MMKSHEDEECPPTPQEFQHVAEILPDVLAAIIEQAAGQPDEPSRSGNRDYAWAA